VNSNFVVNKLKQLKAEDGPDLLVHGSSVLVQTLFANKLVDVLHIWMYPITLGKGKKLFKEGTLAQEWKLKESVISSKGVFMATYEPAGDVKLGSYVPDKVSDAEIERRNRWMKEDKENNG
jgi:dihydrofolate reductase